MHNSFLIEVTRNLDLFGILKKINISSIKESPKRYTLSQLLIKGNVRKIMENVIITKLFKRKKSKNFN